MSRIIAGVAGGRRLLVPPGEGTRPTTDRVREALFSALASWAGRSAAEPSQALVGLAVLDLFAGSGAVGLEASSRGAAPVVLVESSRRTVTVSTARNVAALGLRAEVRTLRVEVLVALTADRAYDIVFADPPYALATEHVDTMARQLIDQGWLAGDGLLVVERSSRSEPPSWPDGLNTWSRRYGETELHFAAR